MGAILIDRWLHGLERVAILDGASVSVAREAVRVHGARLGLSDVVVGRLALVVSELATNQLAHALDGFVAVAEVERDGVVGLEIVAADRGPGIGDPTAALDGRVRAQGSLGAGLAAVHRLGDELDLDVRLGLGTCVRSRVFASPVGRRREVAILGRNCQGERVSGDDATVRRDHDAVTLAIADGLGHGPEARKPALRAIELVESMTGAEPEAILEAADRALKGTRGAVMTIVRVDERTGSLVHASVGNVAALVRHDREKRAFAGSNFVLGAPGEHRRVRGTEGVLGPRDLLVVYSDGLRTRLDLAVAEDVLSRHPMVVAQRLLEHFGRDNDDATVVVLG